MDETTKKRFRASIETSGKSKSTARQYSGAVSRALRDGMTLDRDPAEYAASIPPASGRLFLTAWNAYLVFLGAQEAPAPRPARQDDRLIPYVISALVDQGRPLRAAKEAGSAVRNALRKVGGDPYDAQGLRELLMARSAGWSYHFLTGWRVYRELHAQAHPTLPALPVLELEASTRTIPREVGGAVAVLHEHCGIPMAALMRLTWADVDDEGIMDRANGPGAYFGESAMLPEALRVLRAWGAPAADDAPLLPREPGSPRPMPYYMILRLKREGVELRESALGRKYREREAAVASRVVTEEQRERRRQLDAESAALEPPPLPAPILPGLPE